MIWVGLVIFNLVLVYVLLRDVSHITEEQLLVGLVALMTALDFIIPHGHPIRSARAIPGLLLICIMVITPVPYGFVREGHIHTPTRSTTLEGHKGEKK